MLLLDDSVVVDVEDVEESLVLLLREGEDDVVNVAECIPFPIL